jgi:GT2 family glycosyltransferase
MTSVIKNKRVLITIVNFNGAKDTLECLESLKYLKHKNFQIMVVDNNSTDDSMSLFVNAFKRSENIFLPEFVARACDERISGRLQPVFVNENVLTGDYIDTLKSYPLIICKNKHNIGFAGGNNIALRYALQSNNFDYIWLLNNDTVVHPNSLTRMLARSIENGDQVTCGSKVMHYHDPDVIQALGGGRFNRWTGLSSTSFGRGLRNDEEIDHAHYEDRLSYISGCSWLLPLQFIRDIGLMEEEYFLYCEEADWCARSRNKYGLVYAKDSIVWHKEGASIGSPNGTNPSTLFSDYYIFRNKLKLVRRFNPIALPIAWTVSLLQSINRMRRGQWRKARLILQVIFGIAGAER